MGQKTETVNWKCVPLGAWWFRNGLSEFCIFLYNDDLFFCAGDLYKSSKREALLYKGHNDQLVGKIQNLVYRLHGEPLQSEDQKKLVEDLEGIVFQQRILSDEQSLTFSSIKSAARDPEAPTSGATAGASPRASTCSGSSITVMSNDSGAFLCDPLSKKKVQVSTSRNYKAMPKVKPFDSRLTNSLKNRWGPMTWMSSLQSHVYAWVQVSLSECKVRISGQVMWINSSS